MSLKCTFPTESHINLSSVEIYFSLLSRAALAHESAIKAQTAKIDYQFAPLKRVASLTT